MPKPIVLQFLGDTKDLQAKLAKLDAQSSATGKSFGSKLAGAGKLAAAGIATAAIAVGAYSLEVTDKFEKAHAALETALTNTGTSFDKQKKAIDAVEKSGEKLGFTHTEIEQSLAAMTTGMGSSTKAIGLLGVAQDLARSKNISLADAANIVTKASEGQLKPLKALGIDLPVAAGGAESVKKAMLSLQTAQLAVSQVEEKIHDGRLKGKAASDAFATAMQSLKVAQSNYNDSANSSNVIVKTLGERLSGAAAKQSDTFAGKLQTLKAQGEDLGVKIGQKLIPILEKLMKAVANVVTWLSKHHDVAIALAAVVGGLLTTAFLSWAVSLFTAEGALAILATPITLVVLGIAAMAAGIIYLWTHWDQVWNLIMHHKAYAIIAAILLPIPAMIFAVVAVAKFLYDNWSTIWSGIQKAVQFAWAIIGPIFNAVKAYFGNMVAFVDDLVHGRWMKALGDLAGMAKAGVDWAVSFFVGMPMRILGALAPLGGWLLGVGKGAVNGMISVVNDGIHFLNSFKIPSVTIPMPPGVPDVHLGGWGGFGIPDIPRLAKGGLVSEPMMAMIGDAGPGNPEIVSPERKMREIVQQESSDNSRTFNVTVNANTKANADEIVREALWAMKTSGV